MNPATATPVRNELDLDPPSRRLRRRGLRPRRSRLGRGAQRLEPGGRPASGRRRSPRERRGRRRRRPLRPRGRPPGLRPGHRPQRRRLRRPRRQPADQDRADARRSRSTPRRGSPGSRPASPGARWSARRPSTGSPRSPAPPTTSAWSATRSAAASAGSPASTASPADRIDSRSRSSRPTASVAGPPPTRDAELFWALRGGGGNFGVVTAMEFSLLPLQEVYAGALFFPLERAGEVLEAWRRWTATVPDEVDLGRPHAPVPADARDPRAAARQLVRGRRGGLPRRRGARRRADRAAARARAGHGHVRHDRPRRAARSSTWTRPARSRAWATTRCSPTSTPASLEALVEAVGPGTGSPLLSFEFRHLGGALGRPPRGQRRARRARGPLHDASASASRRAPEMAPPLAAPRWRGPARRSTSSTAARHYGNFAEHEVEPERDLRRAHPEAACARSRTPSTPTAVCTETTRSPPPDGEDRPTDNKREQEIPDEHQDRSWPSRPLLATGSLRLRRERVARPAVRAGHVQGRGQGRADLRRRVPPRRRPTAATRPIDSSRTRRIKFKSKKPVLLTATRLPGVKDPVLTSGTKALRFPTKANITRSHSQLRHTACPTTAAATAAASSRPRRTAGRGRSTPW